MGFFGTIFKRKGDDDFFASSPPDFSQPVGQSGRQNGTPSESDLYGKDPLQNQSPFDAASAPGDSVFEHDIFRSSNQPTNAEAARAYGQQLSRLTGTQTSYASSTVTTNPVSGHEAQLILERLDTIKAELDAIKQRTMRIERFIEQSEQKQTRRYI